MSLLAVLLMLSACGAERTAATGEDALLQQMIADGYLLPFSPDLFEPEPNLAEVTRLTLSDIQTRIAGRTYISFRELNFSTADRTLTAIYVQSGSRVNAGDVLAELEPLDPEEAERLFLRRRNAEIELERFDRNFAIDRDRRLNELAQAREALDLANDYDWPRLSLELSRREVSHAQFMLNNEQSRERLTRQLDNINEQIAGDQIVAPFDGAVVWVANINPGSVIYGRPAIIVMVEEDSLFFTAELPATDALLTREEMFALFRHGEILTLSMHLTDEILYFDVRVANDPWVTGNRNAMRYLFELLDMDAFYDAMEEREIDLILTNAPNFAVEIPHFAVDVLAVHAGAIQTVNDVSHVYIYENGYRRRQNIVVGAWDRRGNMREVLTGLHEGQRVIVWR
jgi:multidrug efflux pump subunit AcrA (membrane-fusion protein)